MLKYPAQESAIAYAPENGTPFDTVVIGSTSPIENYFVTISSSTDHLRIEHILDGEGEYLVDGQWVKARAGDTFILRPNSAFTCRGRVEKVWLLYRANYVVALLDTYNVPSGIYRIPQIRKNFDAITRLTRDNPASMYVYFDIAEDVLKIIHRIAFSIQNQEADCAMSIRNILNSMIYQKADLTEIANTMHMSKANVIRVFKKSFGITPYRYLLDQKIESAKILLKETNIPIKAISERLCITDEHYFSELFKKHTGVSPKKYRKE